VSGRGGVRVCYCCVCALRIDAEKMCAVDMMFTSGFLGTVLFIGCCALSIAVMFSLLPYGNYVYVTRCLEFWYDFGVIQYTVMYQ
jgi:hypothetical protein